MRYDFVSVGDTTTDTFIQLKDGVHVEEELHGKELCLSFGDKLEYDHIDIIDGVGNAGNAAVSAARLGLACALVTDVGKDARGDAACTQWRRGGVDTALVRTHGNIPTHQHFILRYGAERTILIKHEQWPYAVPEFAEAPKWIYFSSVGEHGEAYHHELARYCKENNVKLAFQPGTFQISLGIENIRDIYEATEIFFCNKEEAQRITKNNTDDIRTLAETIQKSGVRIAIITDGPNGAYALDTDGAFWRVPMYPDPAPPVDRTGAGDAFSSTVTACLALGMPLQDALRYGPVNSMSVVQKVGAQAGLLPKKELEQLLAEAPADYVVERIAQ